VRDRTPPEGQLDLAYRIGAAQLNPELTKWDEIAAADGIPKCTLQHFYRGRLEGVGAPPGDAGPSGLRHLTSIGACRTTASIVEGVPRWHVNRGEGEA
jgi:hypothetical protein